MSARRFAARTSREALALVREALGDDAVVLSTKPTADGVEVVAMLPDAVAAAEATASPAVVRAPAKPGRMRSLAERIVARGEHREEPHLAPPAAAAAAPSPASSSLAQTLLSRAEHLRAATGRGKPAADAPRRAAASRDALLEPKIDPRVARDVETLGMSTLTFQDYVRERMLRRRQAELEQGAAKPALALPRGVDPDFAEAVAERQAAQQAAQQADLRAEVPVRGAASPLRVVADNLAARRRAEAAGQPLPRQATRREAPVLRDEVVDGDGPVLADDDAMPPSHRDARAGRAARGAERTGRDDRTEVMGELRQVRHLIEERFGMLAYMERMQKDPRQVNLLQRLFDAGLSPGLVRKLAQALPADATDEAAWAAAVLERNLVTGERDAPLEDHEGVLALIGPTGVGKTTTTAKIAAAFAARHGAAQLGLITLDAYRVGAHEQLRTYGRILGVPVHTAHDRASLEDLMALLAGKRLVLIDTAGVAQRDTRTRELLEMLSHREIEKVLVVNAAAQGETIEDVLAAYQSASCKGVILSKLDEAVKLGPALDALIRQRAKVLGVTNGQRVPEDWHRLSASALVQRALRGGGSASWRLDANEVNLVFAATHGSGFPAPMAPMASPTPGADGLHA